MTRPALLFVVPAWGRVEVAAVCFRQLSHLCAEISDTVDAQALVIADDANLAAAAAAGLLTLERPNQLGAKLNAGYAYAAAHGFTHACPADSDSWLDPERFRRVPAPKTLAGSVRYSMVDPARRRRSALDLARQGVRRVIPLGLLAGCGYAPLEAHRGRGCHIATLAAIRATNGRVLLRDTPGDHFDEVGFVTGRQVTAPDLFRRRSMIREERGDPFHGLDRRYPAPLVEAMRAVFGPIGGTHMHAPTVIPARGFRLRPGPHRVQAGLVTVDAGEVYRTADAHVAARLAADPLLEEVSL